MNCTTLKLSVWVDLRSGSSGKIGMDIRKVQNLSFYKNRVL